MVWENRKYSLGCRNCGRNDTKHHGLGLCQPCYKIPEVNAAAKEGTLVEFDFTSLRAKWHLKAAKLRRVKINFKFTYNVPCLRTD